MGQALPGDAGHRGSRRDGPALAAFLSALALIAAQGRPETAQVGQVTAVAWPRQMPLALALAEEADRPRAWPGLAASDPGPIRLIVVPDRAAMERLTAGRAPGWGAGIALPGSRTIMIRVDAGDPEGTLRHELAHLALRHAIRVTVPRWFDEGYASYAAGEWGRMDAVALNLAVLRGDLPDLDALNAALQGSEAQASVAYALAMTAVMEAARRHPDHSLAPLLALLGQGVPFDTALRRSTGLTMGQFDAAWQRDVRRRYGWLGWFTLGGIWFLVAIGVLVAAWVRRHLDRPRRAALDVGWPEPDDDPELDQPRQSG